MRLYGLYGGHIYKLLLGHKGRGVVSILPRPFSSQWFCFQLVVKSINKSEISILFNESRAEEATYSNNTSGAEERAGDVEDDLRDDYHDPLETSRYLLTRELAIARSTCRWRGPRLRGHVVALFEGAVV